MNQIFALTPYQWIWTLYIQIPGLWFICLIMCLKCIVFPIISTMLLGQIISGSTNFIKYYLFLELVKAGVSNYFDKRKLLIEKYIYNSIQSTSIKKYYQLSFESKICKPFSKLKNLINDTSNSIHMIFEWGLPCVLHLLGTGFSVAFIFITKGFGKLLLFVCIIIPTIYFKWIKQSQINFTSSQKSNKKKKQQIQSLIELNSIPFQYKERGPEYMESLYDTKNSINQEMTKRWHSIQLIIMWTNVIICVCINWISSSSTSNFILMNMMVSQLTNCIQSIGHFLTQYNRYISDIELYIDFWSGCVMMIEPERLTPSSNLEICSVNISRLKFTVKCDFKISLRPGTKILIQGKSGHGKSTLMDGLTGKIDGVVLSEANPENYYWCMADMFQNIKEKMPSCQVTIRNYFKDEPDDLIIYSHLVDTFEEDEIEFLKSNLLDPNEPKSLYDCELDEKISGGQKNRLILATRLYEISKFKKQILIMDEPEQGSDPCTTIQVLKNIFKKYSNYTIIMVSHMSKDQLDSTGIIWDYKLRVEKGQVYLM